MNNHDLLFKRIIDRNYIKTFYIFKSTIEAGGIRKLNKINNMPISSISRYLKTIEDDLGIKIFEKDTKTFTHEAKKLYNIIEPLFTTISVIDRSIKSLSTGNEENGDIKIRIGTHHISFSEFFPKIIKNYINKYYFEIDIIDRDTAFEMLRKLELDILVYPLDKESLEKYNSRMPDFQYVKLGEYKLFVYMSFENKLSKISPILIEQDDFYHANLVPNKNYSKVLFPFATRKMYDMEKEKKTPRFVTSVSNTYILKNFIKYGLCVTITSKMNIDEIGIMPLQEKFYKDSNKEINWYMMYRKKEEGSKEEIINKIENEIRVILLEYHNE